MQLFYTEELLEDSTQCELAENEVHHVANVLRLGVGEAITLTNGKGLLGEGSIVVATKKKGHYCIAEGSEDTATCIP